MGRAGHLSFAEERLADLEEAIKCLELVLAPIGKKVTL